MLAYIIIINCVRFEFLNIFEASVEDEISAQFYFYLKVKPDVISLRNTIQRNKIYN